LFRVAEEVLPMGEPCTGGSREIGPRGRIGGEKGGWKTVEFAHWQDLLCHPEQVGRVVHRSGHVVEMGESDSKRSLFPGTALRFRDKSPTDVAGPVNHPAHLFRVAEEVLPMGEPCTGGREELVSWNGFEVPG
jgi:hypothetical protein